ncbi:MAG: carbohydrate binding family 9 domain-containing protein, partial [Flavobacteriaceae bacterium]|nr:carbohydrate binding family 9 domain-containing protein [Flavobacteriaceae bacterium]
MKKIQLLSILIVSLTFSKSIYGQMEYPETVEKRIYTTKKITTAPIIDGKLNDATWDAVAWDGDFKQWRPDEGKNPTQKTKFKIVYDEKNLYIAIRCYDTDPSKIVKRLSRRDGFDGDWVEVNIDSYHDLRTAFSFTVSSAGVKGDEAISK